MSLLQLTLALLVLLLTPGPTNTLMLVAGSEGGWRRVAALIPVEVAAYLSVIFPVAALSDLMLGQLAWARPALAAGAALWVLFLAYRLWQPQAAIAGQHSITALRLAVTTLLNPKALLMGIALLPASGPTTAAWFTLAGCIAVAAAAWGGIGIVLPRAGLAAPGLSLLRKAAAVWLAGLSVMLLAGGIGSA